jgi:GGDEF domain-containing protein
MEQIKPIKLFELDAASLLPGFLYSFNIADFKRRNCHFGDAVGDAEIAEFDGLIVAAARPDGTARRVGGDRWLMLSRSNANERVRGVLDGYQRVEPFTSGWRVRATRDGEERIADMPLATVMRRAVRCLYTEVASQAALAPAIAALEENNRGPVNIPYPLSQVSAQRRAPWQCVEQCPKYEPACPFCGGRQFEWIDGDDCVSDGICKDCGAEITVDYIR